MILPVCDGLLPAGRNVRFTPLTAGRDPLRTLGRVRSLWAVRWFRLFSYTLFYWVCALLLVGFIAFMHGDCWADGSKAQIAECANQKRLLMIVGLVLAMVPYIFVARRALRLHR